MVFHSLIIDHFFDKPLDVRNHALKQVYTDVTSPFDHVTYPDISVDLTNETKTELHAKLQALTGLKIGKSVEFVRLSKKGVRAPHQAHTDLIMGHYTALVYLNRPEDCQGGTTILKHVSGMEVNPRDLEEEAIWRRDTNDESQWIVQSQCPMAFNRMYLVRSDLYHRAEPLNGFGTDVENGRLVLVCFFIPEGAV